MSRLAPRLPYSAIRGEGAKALTEVVRHVEHGELLPGAVKRGHQLRGITDRLKHLDGLRSSIESLNEPHSCSRSHGG